MLKIKFPFLLLSLFILFQACGNKKTASGLEYKILADSTGENAKYGDLVILQVKYNNSVDSLDTYKAGRPVSLMLDSTVKGGLEEGLTFLSKGDSAQFIVLNDSLYKNTFHLDSLPKGVKKGSKTTFTVKVVNVMNAEQMKKERAEQAKKRTQQMLLYMSTIKKEILDSAAAQLKTDDKIIQDYIKKNKLNAQKTENGIYYVITQEGTGAVAAPGDTASINYVGKLLSGKEFDKSRPGMPLVFQVGVGNVIPGFDEPLTNIKEGSKATLIIPSPFAYSKQGVKNPAEKDYTIPPNSILLFDIEALKYSKMK